MDSVLYMVITPPPFLKNKTYEITYIKITKKGPQNPYTLIPLTLSPGLVIFLVLDPRILVIAK